MELKIQVCADDSCIVIVKDITEVGDNGYLPESSAVTVKIGLNILILFL